MINNISPLATNYTNQNINNNVELPKNSTMSINQFLPNLTQGAMPYVYTNTMTNLSDKQMAIQKDENNPNFLTMKLKETEIKKPRVGVVETPFVSLAPVMDSLNLLKTEMGERATIKPKKEKIALESTLTMGALGLSIIGILAVLIKFLIKKP